MADVVVLDYGAGNLRSVARALEAAGATVAVSPDVRGARLVVPGVGAFAEARRRLEPQWAALQAYAASGQPLLGICLGFQLLFQRSYEHGTHEGLGVFAGEVVPLPQTTTVPHMGWNRLSGLGGPDVYFAHSYAVAATPDALATVEHGGWWTAAVKRGAVTGYQFHPEKSGDAGIALLRAWLGEAGAPPLDVTAPLPRSG